MEYLNSIQGCKGIRIEQRPGMGTGVADILICFRGKFIAIEVKVPGGKATPLQMHFLNQITISGGLSAVVYSVEEVKCLVQMLALMPPSPISEVVSPSYPSKGTKNLISNGQGTKLKSPPRTK